MNSKHILLLALLLCSLSASAQVSFSVQAGANYNTTHFKNLETYQFDANPRWGYFIAVAPAIKLNEKISVHTEFEYSLEGYKTSAPIGGELKYDFMRLLPQVEGKITENISVLLGGNVGYKLSEQYRDRDKDWFTLENAEHITDWDWGIVAGGKYKVNHFFVSVRYYLGLANISNLKITDIDGIIQGDLRQRSRNLQVGVGYLFD